MQETNNIQLKDLPQAAVKIVNAAALNITKLPELSYVAVQVPNSIGIAKRGETGYYKTDFSAGETFEETVEVVNHLNDRMGVTRGQAKAMENGSMFGFHVPAANPDNYDENGKFIV